MTQKYLNQREAAAHLGVSLKFLWQNAHRGHIPYHTIEGKKVFALADIERCHDELKLDYEYYKREPARTIYDEGAEEVGRKPLESIFDTDSECDDN
ncbi:MAG: helix-turn-helix domain-containing protein [Thermoguttaceae bacterium]